MSKLRDLSRRDVIRGGLAAAALGLTYGCSSTKPVAAPPPTKVAPVPKKRILILGGTGFIGPKTIGAAIARGHTVTIFNRGKREKLLPLEFEVEHLYGNRDPDKPADEENPEGSPKGLEQLVGKKWDVVIDNSGFYPRIVEASAQLLAPNAARYIFISSISAYGENPADGGDETTRVAQHEGDPSIEEMGKESQNYGPFKVMCEQAAEKAFPGRTAIVRPGYIVGPGDPTDRFTYWPVRISRGGEVLAPGSPDDPLQWIDVRDLAEWLVTLVENETVGTFNAVGPTKPGRWGDVLADCAAAAGSGAGKLEWVPAKWLEENGQGGEDGFPIWIPPVDKYAGFHKWKNARAIATGLKLRPMSETAKALLAWYPGEVERRIRVTRELEEAAKAKGAPPPKGPDPKLLRAGPPPEREQELLAKWKAKG
jgi:2'-hydroxyisoflavone reductase